MDTNSSNIKRMVPNLKDGDFSITENHTCLLEKTLYLNDNQ